MARMSMRVMVRVMARAMAGMMVGVMAEVTAEVMAGMIPFHPQYFFHIDPASDYFPFPSFQ